MNFRRKQILYGGVITSGLGLIWLIIWQSRNDKNDDARHNRKLEENQQKHIRFLPEGSENDKITSVSFKDHCDFSTLGVLEPIDLTPEETAPAKKKWGYKTVPLDVWISQQSSSSEESGPNNGD